MCPDEWLYHKINVTEEDWPQIAGQLGGDHHVRVRAAVLVLPLDLTTHPLVPLTDAPPYVSALLVACATLLQLRLAVTEGDITAITAPDHPPLFLYPPVTHVSELDTAAGGPAELHFCNVKEGHAYYIGVVGTGRTCASYTVSASCDTLRRPLSPLLPRHVTPMHLTIPRKRWAACLYAAAGNSLRLLHPSRIRCSRRRVPRSGD